MAEGLVWEDGGRREVQERAHGLDRSRELHIAIGSGGLEQANYFCAAPHDV